MLRFKQLQRLVTSVSGPSSSVSAIFSSKKIQQQDPAHFYHQNQILITQKCSYWTENKKDESNYEKNHAQQRQNYKQNNFQELNRHSLQSQNHQSHPNKQSYQKIFETQEFQDAFVKQFGHKKQQQMDIWLEMSAENLIQECNKYKLKSSERHIENLQALFEHVKQVESNLAKKIQKDFTNQGKNFFKKSEYTQEEVRDKQQNNNNRRYSIDDLQNEEEDFVSSHQSNENAFSGKKENMFQKSKYNQSGNSESQRDNKTSYEYAQKNSFEDFGQAKQNLNEQLQKIFEKRRRLTEGLINESSSFASKKQKQSQTSNSQGQTAEVTYETQSKREQVKRYQKSDLISRMVERKKVLNNLNKEKQSSNLSSSGLTWYIKYLYEDQKSKIQHVINSQKINYESDSRMMLQNQMIENTQNQFFQNQLHAINLNFNLNPNFTMPYYLSDLTKEENLQFILDNFSLLSKQVQNQLESEIMNLFNDPNLKQNLIKNQIALGKFVDCLLLSNLSQEKQSKARDELLQLMTADIKKTYQNINLEKGMQISKAIRYIKIDEERINERGQDFQRLQDAHVQKLRPYLDEKSVKQLYKNECLNLLFSLPIIQKHQRWHDIQKNEDKKKKAGKYNLQHDPALNELIRSNQEMQYWLLSRYHDSSYFEEWNFLPKQINNEIIERGISLNSSKDLVNKQWYQTTAICLSQYSIEELLEYYKLIEQLGKPGSFESKAISIAFKLCQKTLTYVPNANEVSKYVDLYEYIFKVCPISFVGVTFDLKLFIHRVNELQKTQYLKLQDMVRLSKSFIPSLYDPTYMFKQMIEKDSIILDDTRNPPELIEHNHNFKTDANLEDLYQLVDESVKRVDESMNVFDHLSLSNSKVHKHFQPMKEKSFILWWKIVDDLMSEGPSNIKPEEMTIINRLFSNEKILANFFTDSEHFKKIIDPLLESQINQSTQNLKALKKLDAINESDNIITQDRHFDNMTNQIKSLENILHTSRESNVLSSVSKITGNIIETVNQMLVKTQKFDLDGLLKFSHEIFLLIEKIQQVSKENKINFQQGSPKYQHFETLLMPIREIIQSSIEYHFNLMKPFLQVFEDSTKNMTLSKQILEQTSGFMIENNTNSIISFFNNANNSGLDSSHLRNLSLRFLQSIKNSRALVGRDLVGLYNLIEKYSLQEHTVDLIVNTGANLLTIERSQLNRSSAELDEKFEVINKKLKDHELDLKKKILKKFISIQQEFTHKQKELQDKSDKLNPLKQETAILGPLSKFMADIVRDDPEDYQQALVIFLVLINTMYRPSLRFQAMRDQIITMNRL